MQPLLNIAITAARNAGDIIIRYMDQIDRIKISTKHNNTEIFSEVDVKAEQAIIQSILKAYPAHGYIAEESGVVNEDAECVWIIDPLDGTNNYLHGFPFFAVSIACRVKNRIEHGVIYDPLRHECFAASRGDGARLNDRRIRVSKQTQFSAAMIGTGFSTRTPAETNPYLSAFASVMGKCGQVRRLGAVALDLAYVASGRLDGSFGFKLYPWDFAAGSLLIKEAGGLVSDLDGSENYFTTGNIISGTPKIFKGLVQALSAR